MNALLILALLVLAVALLLCRDVLFVPASIDMRAPVSNSAHKFGEANAYFLELVINADGIPKPALFTADQVSDAIHRALRNTEDL